MPRPHPQAAQTASANGAYTSSEQLNEVVSTYVCYSEQQWDLVHMLSVSECPIQPVNEKLLVVCVL